MGIGKSVETWREDFAATKFSWCVEDAEETYMGPYDHKGLDPMDTWGYDGKSAGYFLEALGWLHVERNTPVPEAPKEDIT